MDLKKRYFTQQGDCCDIVTLVKKEPEWAANRIQEGEKAIEILKATNESTAEALSEAVEKLYFSDNSDYATALWKIVELLGGQEAVDLLESNESVAYNKYCKRRA